MLKEERTENRQPEMNHFQYADKIIAGWADWKRELVVEEEKESKKQSLSK